MDEKDPTICSNEVDLGGPALVIDQADNKFSEKLLVKVLDRILQDSTPTWKQQTWENTADFKSAMEDCKDVKQRIISFHSVATCSPLKASRDDFQALRHQYDIHPEFLNTLTAFGRFPDPANGYAVTATVCRNYTSMSDPRSFEMWYRLQYPEQNHRSIQNPWSIRHTGIYHQFNARRDFNLIILIHPCRDTILETSLFDPTSALGGSARARLADDALSIHQMLCDMYLPNWSPCIRDQSKSQEQTNDDVQTSDLKTGNLESDFRTTQHLRFLKNATATNRLLCQDNIVVLDELRAVFAPSTSKHQWLNINKAKASARCDSLLLLQERIQNDLDLLEHAAAQRDSMITHRNQAVAARLNETLLTLTYNTVDDSATIKVITVLSLIFLPGSFIATIFGMNFFAFEDDSSKSSNDAGATSDTKNSAWNGLVIGRNFWIFVATWLPVTAVVLLIYASVIWRKRRAVERRRIATKLAGEEGPGIV